MSIVAICAATDMAEINADLAAAGYGPGKNFAVPVYNGDDRPSNATLHCVNHADFLAFLQADSRVTVSTSETGTPRDRVQAMIDAQGLKWPGNAPLLPDSGMVQAGEYYRTVNDIETRFWRIITQFSRNTYPDPPEQLPPAIIREARIPGQVREWQQPIDQFDAYLTVDPFTGQPERVTYLGSTWDATDGSAGGPAGSLLNTWEPGVFGWTEVV